MPCPFGFAAPPDSSDVCDDSDAEKPRRRKVPCCATAPRGNHGMMDVIDARPPAQTKDPRFDYNKDPISWFYQNQIRSEEEFQASKARLRAEARDRLDHIFELKGKHLVIDSDDDFSIASSELSAWDSDVDSVSSLVSCAAEWADETGFKAPAMAQLRVALALTTAAACYTGWQSLQATLQVNKFWGVMAFGWIPWACMADSAAALAVCGASWYIMGSLSKRSLLAVQLSMQVVYAGAVLVGVLAFASPAQVDASLRSSVCGAASRGNDSKLCRVLPFIEEQVLAAMRAILWGAAALALCSFALCCAVAWYHWELSYVEKKAIKHKRRRKARRHGIPWDRIKVEPAAVGAPLRAGRSAAPAGHDKKNK